MKINIRKSAIRDFKKLGKKDKELISAKIMEISEFPNVQNVKKLTNFEPAYRLRIGDFRILFDVDGDNIEIGRILNRKESYRTK
jgi:mRNA interferase RelE/StbE